MSWENRPEGRYYTRSRRTDGRIVRVYVGGGEVGERAAADDARRRAEALNQADEARDDQRRHVEAVASLAELVRWTDRLVAAALAAAGFHRPRRGVWRRKRHAANR